MSDTIFVVRDNYREDQIRGIFSTRDAADRCLAEHAARYGQSTGEVWVYRLAPSGEYVETDER